MKNPFDYFLEYRRIKTLSGQNIEKDYPECFYSLDFYLDAVQKYFKAPRLKRKNIYFKNISDIQWRSMIGSLSTFNSMIKHNNFNYDLVIQELYEELCEFEWKKTFENFKKEKGIEKFISYEDFLKSDYWKNLKLEIRKKAKYKCQICNNPNDLIIHHRTYENNKTKYESDDLICICNECHNLIHRHRPIDGKIRNF